LQARDWIETAAQNAGDCDGRVELTIRFLSLIGGQFSPILRKQSFKETNPEAAPYAIFGGLWADEETLRI